MSVNYTLLETKAGVYLLDEETGAHFRLPCHQYSYTRQADVLPKVSVDLIATKLKFSDSIEAYLTERLRDTL